MKKHPFSNWLLSKFVSEELVEELIGDLQELHETRVGEKGKLLASVYYLVDLLSLIWSLGKTKKRHTKSNIMIGNYLKVSWRNALKNKSQSLINILGMTIGITVFFFIYAHVTYQKSFDDFHKDSNRIFRVGANLATPNREFHFAITPPWVGPALESTFTGVESFVRMSKRSGDIKYKDITYRETGIYYADPAIFDVFSFELISQDTRRPLADPYTVVISEKAARKYFGNEDPIGKIIMFRTDTTSYFIQGVFNDIPSNSHLQFDFLLSNATLVAQGNDFNAQWFYFNCYTYVLLQEGVDPDKVESGLAKFTDDWAGDAEKSAGQEIEIFLQPLKTLHLESNLEVEPQETINLATLNIFSGIGVLTLLMACINFINLSTVTSLNRAKEVGIRKVAGALKSGIVYQFIVDAFLMISISGILGGIMVYILSPLVYRIGGVGLHPEILLEYRHLVVLAGIFASMILLSGVYPGMLISNLKLINILKGKFQKSRSGILFRKVLVVVQLIITISLIIGAIIVQDQWKVLANTDPGFKKEGLITINFYSNPEIGNRYEVVKQELLSHPDVNSVSASFNIPSDEPLNWYLGFENASGEMENTSMFSYVIDQDFLETYGLTLLAGRNFSGMSSLDSASFIINESAAMFFGYETPSDAIGKKLAQFGTLGEVIGVIKDFHARSLKYEMEPLVIQSNPGFFRYLTLQTTSNDYNALLSDLNTIWLNKISTRKPEFSILESDLENLYQKESTISSLITGFCFLAICISVLGLWGLSGFSVAQDKKAISIRKVLGANVLSMLVYYNKSYIFLILFSWIFASTIAYFGLQSWLNTYPFRVELGVNHFIVSGLIAFLVVIATISYNVIIGARVKPVKNLRLET